MFKPGWFATIHCAFALGLAAPSAVAAPHDLICQSPKNEVLNLGVQATLEGIRLGLYMNPYSANDSQIASAPCSRAEPFSQKEMSGWIEDHLSGEKTVNEELNGFHFRDEDPRLLDLFRKLTTYHPDLMTFFESSLKAPKRWTSSCEKVVCAVQEIFGQAEGVQLLYMLGKYGFNGSHIAFPHPFPFPTTKPWTAKQLDDVLLALSDLPEHLYPIRNDQQLVMHTFDIGGDPILGGRTIANSSISVFPAWTAKTPPSRRYSIFHEVGHLLGQRSLDATPAWMGFSGWKHKVGEAPAGETQMPASLDKVVSSYGETNHEEDFAESVTAYRYNPQALKKADPEKYEYLKNLVFDGIEYLAADQCKKPKLLSEAIVSKLVDEFKDNSKAEDLLGASNPADCMEKVFENWRRKSAAVEKKFSENFPDSLPRCLNESVAARKVLETATEARIPHGSWVEQAQWFKRLKSTLSDRLPGEGIQKAFKSRLKKALLEGLLELAAENEKSDLRMEIGEEIDPYIYCGLWARNKVSAFEKPLVQAGIREKSDFFVLVNADVLREMGEKACLSIQEGNSQYQPMTSEDLKRAFEEVY